MTNAPGFVTASFDRSVVFVDVVGLALKYKADAVRVDHDAAIFVLVNSKWKFVGQGEPEDLSHWKVGGSE